MLKLAKHPRMLTIFQLNPTTMICVYQPNLPVPTGAAAYHQCVHQRDPLSEIQGSVLATMRLSSYVVTMIMAGRLVFRLTRPHFSYSMHRKLIVSYLQ